MLSFYRPNAYVFLHVSELKNIRSAERWSMVETRFSTSFEKAWVNRNSNDPRFARFFVFKIDKTKDKRRRRRRKILETRRKEGYARDCVIYSRKCWKGSFQLGIGKIYERGFDSTLPSDRDSFLSRFSLFENFNRIRRHRSDITLRG